MTKENLKEEFKKHLDFIGEASAYEDPTYHTGAEHMLDFIFPIMEGKILKYRELIAYMLNELAKVALTSTEMREKLSKFVED